MFSYFQIEQFIYNHKRQQIKREGEGEGEGEGEVVRVRKRGREGEREGGKDICCKVMVILYIS